MSRFPSNITALYDKNTALLERLSFTPGTDNPSDLCTTDVYRSTGLFSEAMVQTIFADHPLPPRAPTALIAKHVGMILVRPDMMHARPAFEAFIKQRFKLLASESVEIDSQTYWRIYQHDLHRKETMHTRLSRAALYIGSVCQLLVFRGADDLAVADHTYTALKGRQGVYEPGTLRGDIVYRAATGLRLHCESVDPVLQLATDPFGAYRAAIAEPEGPHRALRYPLLFYTGVGVHVPDGTEIDTDLPQLLSRLDNPISAQELL